MDRHLAAPVEGQAVTEHLTLMNRALQFTERLQHFILLRRHPAQLRLLPLQLIAPSFQVVLLLLRFPLLRLLLLLPLRHHQLIFPPSQEVQLGSRHHVSLTLKRRCYSARTTSSSETTIYTIHRQTHTYTHIRDTLETV